MSKIELTLAQLAQLTGSELVGDSNFLISGVEDLEGATASEISFLANPRYASLMRISKAGAIFIHPKIPRPATGNFLLNQDPSLAFQKAIDAFFPENAGKSGFLGIHPTAVIHPEAVIGEKVTIGPHVVIDRAVKIGDRTTIGPNSSIGAESQIGADCLFYANVTVRERCEIGNRVILQPGAVIGSCGFGYATDSHGKHRPLRQVGRVILEDDVEIGANTTIDRARFKITRIGRGTKIDNLVQIGHQVCVGEDNLIVSQTGIAGSSKTGKNVILAGQVGVIGHITIGDQVILAARSAVIKSLPEPGIYSGTPAAPIREFNEHMVRVRNIGKLEERVKKLEKALVSPPC